MTNNRLSAALKECQQSAQKGYNIASEQQNALNQTLAAAQKKIIKTLREFDRSPCFSPEISQSLNTQLSDINRTLDEIAFSIGQNLEQLRKNIPRFSITLFGKTTAGKSTMMEILTHGSGASIGKGGNRTTRKVCQYTWNNLVITDVPGIGAFEGEKDSESAFDSAKTADLILFLMTSSPQLDEANCFSKLFGSGKPIVCIVNIKKALTIGGSLKVAEKKLNKAFAHQNLDEIRRQFLEYAPKFDQSWEHVPFICTHLLSAFQSQHESDYQRAKTYYELSRFNAVEEHIIRLVQSKGSFLRSKNFIDALTQPLLVTTETLLKQSRINHAQARTLRAKIIQLVAWKEHFSADAHSRIDSLLQKMRGELFSSVAEFAENHFEDENADKAWKKQYQSFRVKSRCEQLLKELEEEANDKLREITREVSNELQFTVSIAEDSSLKMNNITDFKRIWNWTSNIASGGVGIAAGIAALAGASTVAPVLGIIGIGVMAVGFLGSLFIDDFSEKEEEARIELEKNLRNNIEENCKLLHTKMNNILDKLLNKKISGTIDNLDTIYAAISGLADTQQELGWQLCDKLLCLNRQLIGEALSKLGASEQMNKIALIARIPGYGTLLLLKDNTAFPHQIRQRLQYLLGEGVRINYESPKPFVLLSRILGWEVDRSSISVNLEQNTARVPLVNPGPELNNRLRMAQQLCKLQIIIH